MVHVSVQVTLAVLYTLLGLSFAALVTIIILKASLVGNLAHAFEHPGPAHHPIQEFCTLRPTTLQ